MVNGVTCSVSKLQTDLKPSITKPDCGFLPQNIVDSSIKDLT